jgi:hypothetical protein
VLIESDILAGTRLANSGAAAFAAIYDGEAFSLVDKIEQYKFAGMLELRMHVIACEKELSGT